MRADDRAADEIFGDDCRSDQNTDVEGVFVAVDELRSFGVCSHQEVMQQRLSALKHHQLKTFLIETA